MTNLIAPECRCTYSTSLGEKKPEHCEEHGCRYVLASSVGPKKSSTARRSSSGPDRDWTDARAKVDHEECCRICKRPESPGHPLEAAHVLGREHDEPKVSKTTGEILAVLYVDPDRVFPACGPFPAGCHGDVDMRRINYLQHLTLSEQVRAVKDAGGIEAARLRLDPVEHREEIEANAYVPSQSSEVVR